MIAPNPHIAAMAPYALPDRQVPGGADPVSLAQNESLRGPSPRAQAAAGIALAAAHLYPDPDGAALRHALAAAHGLDPAGIVIGAGSLDLIAALACAHAGPERAVLAPEHAYPFFRTAAERVGARLDTATEAARTVDVDALLDIQRADTRLVFVANPGNPTGTRVPVSELGRLREGLRPDVLLVIDEAYGEFADDLGERAFDLVARGDTVVLRTFSKAYGLAGLRVGWGMFPPAAAAEIRKVLNPNAVSSAALAAAEAALDDAAYMRETVRQTAAARDSAKEALRAAGFAIAPSLTNFLLLDFGSAERAASADAALRAGGVVARRQAGAGLPQALRLTIGPPGAMETAVGLLREWKGVRA